MGSPGFRNLQTARNCSIQRVSGKHVLEKRRKTKGLAESTASRAEGNAVHIAKGHFYEMSRLPYLRKCLLHIALDVLLRL